MKKILTSLLSAVFFLQAAPIGMAEETSTSDAYVYENTFDNGIESLKDVSTDFYTFTAPGKDADGPSLTTAELDGNKGLRTHNSSAWANTTSLRFDFKNGVSSGVLSISYDFKMKEDLSGHRADNCDVVSFGYGMKNHWDGGRIGYILADASYNPIYVPMTSIGAWEDWNNTFALDDSVHTISWVFDYTNGVLRHYLDGKKIVSQGNLPEVRDLEFALNGMFTYFDNLRMTYHPENEVETKVLYQNSFNLGSASRKSGTLSDGSQISYTGGTTTSRFNDNTGFGMNSGAWATPNAILYTAKEPLDSGRVRISFDTSRLSREGEQYSYLKLNSENFVFYMEDAGFYGPYEGLGRWGDPSITTPFAKDTLYHIELLYDLDNAKAYTYVNSNLLSVKGMSGQKFEGMEFQLSGINAYFDELKIEWEHVTPVEYRLSSEAFGNTFFGDEPVEIKISATSFSEKNITNNVSYTLTDAKGKVVWQDSTICNFAPDENKVWTIKPQNVQFGAYTLTVEPDYGKISTMALSRCVESEVQNQRFGLCSHFGRYPLDTPNLMKLLKKVGVSGVRFDFPYAKKTEDLAYVDPVLEEAEKNGIDILALLQVSDGSQDEDGGFNTTDEFLADYAAYCDRVARYFDGRIYNFELGNEVNYMKKADKTPDSGADYAKIVKAGYDAIKKAGQEMNKDFFVTTAGTAIVYTDYDRNQRPLITKFLETMRDSGTFSFDGLGVHPYHVAQPPEVVDRWIENHSWPMQAALGRSLLSEYGAGDKKVWATEVGWANYGNNETKAAYHVRMLALNEAGNYNDRTYIYDIIDHGFNTADDEDVYGTMQNWRNPSWNKVTAYAAKPELLALAQWNRMTAGKQVSKMDQSGTQYTEWFNEADKTTAVVWDVEDAGKQVTLPSDGKKHITVYDMYGNVLARDTADSATVTAGILPIYVTFEREAEEIRIEHSGVSISALDNLRNGDEITVAADHANAANAKIICATYLGGRQVNVRTENLSADGKANVTLTYQGEDSIRVFLWNDLDTMNPISTGKTLQRRREN